MSSSSPLPLAAGLQVLEVKEDVVHRPLAHFHPTVWGDFFVTHSPPSQPISEAEMKERVEVLVRQVKVMLLRDHVDVNGVHTFKDSMQLIDAVQRLGVSYHFDQEVDVVLSRINDAQIGFGDQDDLVAVSLWFRLLRQHGYRVSSGKEHHYLTIRYYIAQLNFKNNLSSFLLVMKREMKQMCLTSLKGKDGKFKASLCSDTRGLLSLYEAAYLGTPGEEILDQAIHFTKTHLESMVGDHMEEEPLAALVSRALETPLIRRIKRLDMRHYIAIYQQEDKELRNDVLLELAKLDYHLLQLLHWEEARHITTWMKELGLMQKLTFVRDRVIELFYWITGTYYEPCYSRGRIMMTKIICMTSLMDDLFDSYGTLEEVIQYEDAIQRWELEAANQLPEFFKDHLLAMINTLKGLEDELEIDDKSYRVPCIKDALKTLAKAYLDENIWREENLVPSMEKNLQVSLKSSQHPMLACASYVGMGELATKDAFDWVISFPKIIEASSIIGRLMNDVVSHEFEQKRGHYASTVESYAKEHRTSEQEACKNLNKMVEDGWKVINEECLKPTVVPMPLVMPIINLTRVADAIYKYSDEYTHSSTLLKENITFVFVRPIKI